MRDKNFDVNLLKTLNDQPMPETPLTDDEFTRVLDAACGRLPQKKPAGHRRFPWERVAAAAVACLAVGLGSINFAAPAVAEQLPVVGSLFSWLNRGGQDDYVSLQSEQLNKYAETVKSTAETADSPYILTLGQVFNDGDWLRISLMLTSEDDSLAGFNAIGPREDAVEKALQNGGGQYGTLAFLRLELFTTRCIKDRASPVDGIGNADAVQPDGLQQEHCGDRRQELLALRLR